MNCIGQHSNNDDDLDFDSCSPVFFSFLFCFAALPNRQTRNLLDDSEERENETSGQKLNNRKSARRCLQSWFCKIINTPPIWCKFSHKIIRRSRRRTSHQDGEYLAKEYVDPNKAGGQTNVLHNFIGYVFFVFGPVIKHFKGKQINY